MAPKGTAAVAGIRRVDSAGEGRPAIFGDLLRKALHLSVAAVPVVYAWGLERRRILALLGFGTLVALLLEWARWMSPGFRRAFNRHLGSILKAGERESATAAIWLWPSCLGAVFLLSRDAAVAALWCVTAGDPSAAIAGRVYRVSVGRVEGGGKTAIGSIACFGVSFAGVAGLTHYSVGAAATIAVVAAVFEHLPLAVDDNLMVPLVAGFTAWLLS